MKTPSLKAIWAVDVTAAKKPQFAAFRTLSKLVKGSSAKIEPVTLLTPDQLKVPKDVFRGEAKRYELEAETILKAWVKELKSPQLTSPTLLMQDVYSTNSALDVLLNHARKTGAGLITVGTHNKTGFERLFVGSFAETLMLKSEIPVLIVNPKSPIPSKISKIFFATDFSPASADAFERLLPTAKSLNAKVTIYHKFDYIVPETEAMMRVAPTYTRYLKLDLEAKREKARDWATKAKASGVKTTVLLDERPGFVPESVIKAAKKEKANLIAIASNSGSFGAAILGSVARQVVRLAPFPVWVLHPEKTKSAVRSENEQSASKRIAV